jgi:hypothetical protein
MEVQWWQIGSVWVMWKNFPAPGVQGIHSCGSSVRLSIVVQKNSVVDNPGLFSE